MNMPTVAVRKPSFVAGRSPKENHLLAALPAADYERLLPDLELVPLPLGWSAYESGDEQKHALFPTTGLMAQLYVTEDGYSTATAIVGNEGVVGISVFMGGESTPSRASVYSAGHGYRLAARVLRTEFSKGGSLQGLLLRYTQALMTQTLQTAVCNRYHELEQQFCRLLLLSLDCSASGALTLSHELIGSMLGVRREGVTEAAGRLRTAGVIDYSRGHITVRDRTRLAARACECYAVVKNEYERLLPKVPPPSPQDLRTSRSEPRASVRRPSRPTGSCADLGLFR